MKTNNKDHEFRSNNFRVTPFMERILLKVSDSNGRNANNQISLSHGLHVLVLRYAHEECGIDTKKLYPTVKH